MTKVLVTNPPWIVETPCGRRRLGIRAGSRWPLTTSDYYKPTTYMPYPGFMGYAVSYLQSQGVEARFYDAIASNHEIEAFYRNVDQFKPDIVIQETSTPSFNVDIEIARKLHEKYEICLVGPHATAFAERLIELPFVDYVLKGAYEYSSLQMVTTRRRGIYDFDSVKNLDDLPYPYRDEKIIHHYRECVCKKKLQFPQLWIYGSRGCAFHCSFCLWVHTMYGEKFTLRCPTKILDEVDDMIRKYGFKYILFDDDCWNLGSKTRITQIADGLHKIGVPWSIIGRLDTCDKDVFKYIVDRGCVGLRLGVESLSQRLLDKVDKRLTVEKVMEMIDYLKTLDVSLFLLFMHLIPGETWWDRLKQDLMIRKICWGHPYIVFQNPPCIPFPGTPYYQQFVKQGLDPEKVTDWDEYDGASIGPNLISIAKKYAKKSAQTVSI